MLTSLAQRWLPQILPAQQWIHKLVVLRWNGATFIKSSCLQHSKMPRDPNDPVQLSRRACSWMFSLPWAVLRWSWSKISSLLRYCRSMSKRDVYPNDLNNHWAHWKNFLALPHFQRWWSWRDSHWFPSWCFSRRWIRRNRRWVIFFGISCRQITIQIPNYGDGQFWLNEIWITCFVSVNLTESTQKALLNIELMFFFVEEFESIFVFDAKVEGLRRAWLLACDWAKEVFHLCVNVVNFCLVVGHSRLNLIRKWFYSFKIRSSPLYMNQSN